MTAIPAPGTLKRIELAQNGQRIRYCYFVHSLLVDTLIST